MVDIGERARQAADALRANLNGHSREPIGVLAKDVVPERITWLWRGRLAAGKITILEGDPGLGKSTMTLDLAARITTGTAFPGEATGRNPRGVIVLSAEDGLNDTIVPRLIAAGADLTCVFLMTGVRLADGLDGGVTLPADLGAIEQAVVEHDAALVVIDPLMAYLSADTNSNRDQDVRRALAPLAAMLERTSAACCLVRHLNKLQGGNALYRGGGSIGLTGAARMVLLVAKDPDDETAAVVAPQKCNLASMPPALRYRLVGCTATDAARVTWDAEPVRIDAASLLAAGGDDEERSALSEAGEWLADYLSLGSRPAADVLKAARMSGHPERTLRRAKARLGVQSRRDGFHPDSGWVWSLPQDGQGSQTDIVGNVGSHGEHPRSDAENQGCQDGQECQGGQDGHTQDLGILGNLWPVREEPQPTLPGCGAPMVCAKLGPCPHYVQHGRCWKGQDA